MRLNNKREYIGAVDHPETGELIQLSGVNELEDETLELLASEYHFLTLEGGVNGSETTFQCGVNGCSRKVDNPEDTCWQHGD